MANSIQDKLLQSALKLIPGGESVSRAASMLSQTQQGKQVQKSVQKFTIPKLDPGEPFAAKPKSDFERVIEGDLNRLKSLFPQQAAQELGERRSPTDLKSALERSLATAKFQDTSLRAPTTQEKEALEEQRATTFSKREMSEEDFARTLENNP